MNENLQIFPQNAGVHEALGITVVSADKDKVVVQVPVGEKVHQPLSLIHI